MGERFEPVVSAFRDGVRLLVGAAPNSTSEELAAVEEGSTLYRMPTEDDVKVMFEEAGASREEYESHVNLVEASVNAPTRPSGKIQLSFGGLSSRKVKKSLIFRPIFVSELSPNQQHTGDILQVATRGTPFPPADPSMVLVEDERGGCIVLQVDNLVYDDGKDLGTAFPPGTRLAITGPCCCEPGGDHPFPFLRCWNPRTLSRAHFPLDLVSRVAAHVQSAEVLLAIELEFGAGVVPNEAWQRAAASICQYIYMGSLAAYGHDCAPKVASRRLVELFTRRGCEHCGRPKIRKVYLQYETRCCDECLKATTISTWHLKKEHGVTDAELAAACAQLPSHTVEGYNPRARGYNKTYTLTCYRKKDVEAALGINLGAEGLERRLQHKREAADAAVARAQAEQDAKALKKAQEKQARCDEWAVLPEDEQRRRRRAALVHFCGLLDCLLTPEKLEESATFRRNCNLKTELKAENFKKLQERILQETGVAEVRAGERKARRRRLAEERRRQAEERKRKKAAAAEWKARQARIQEEGRAAAAEWKARQARIQEEGRAAAAERKRKRAEDEKTLTCDVEGCVAKQNARLFTARGLEDHTKAKHGQPRKKHATSFWQ